MYEKKGSERDDDTERNEMKRSGNGNGTGKEGGEGYKFILGRAFLSPTALVVIIVGERHIIYIITTYSLGKRKKQETRGIYIRF